MSNQTSQDVAPVLARVSDGATGGTPAAGKGDADVMAVGVPGPTIRALAARLSSGAAASVPLVFVGKGGALLAPKRVRVVAVGLTVLTVVDPADVTEEHEDGKPYVIALADIALVTRPGLSARVFARGPA